MNKDTTTKGFTLIELLVVVVLIGVISAIVFPTVSGFFKVSLQSATRELASVVKETYNSAIITKKSHRIVYDIDRNEFWSEVGPENLLLDTDESRENEKKRRNIFFKDKKEDEPRFKMAKDITEKKKSLPSGVKFVDILSERSKEPITSGLAYTHILPEGFAEKTILHLTNSSNHKVTLNLSQLAGTSKLFEGHLTEEEVLREH